MLACAGESHQQDPSSCVYRVYWETATFTYPFVQQHWSSGVLSTGLKLSARTRRTYSPGSLKVTVVVARLPASSSGSGRSSLNNATAGP